MTDIEAEAGIRLGDEMSLPDVFAGPEERVTVRGLRRTAPGEIEAFVVKTNFAAAVVPVDRLRPISIRTSPF